MMMRYAINLHYKLRGLVGDGIIGLPEINIEHVLPWNFSLPSILINCLVQRIVCMHPFSF